MVFSSIPFLFYFLPCTLIMYFAAPRGAKNAALLLASLVFYAWGEPRYVLLMLAAILQGYLFGRLIERSEGRRRKLMLTACVGLSIAILGVCKYADFFIENFNAATGLSLPLLKLALPVGVSFYTFQLISYAVDVYRGTARAQKNFINLAAYVAMFPQLIAGPIVRYADIAAKLESREHSAAMASAGLRRFVIGLGKKILIANTLAELVSVFKASDEKSVLFFWVYAVAYTLQVYYDFSGYSDMAIGLGKIFGFEFRENFNYPYVSRSATEFWRRWHISLGSWFRDYVYIPLGGNRVSRIKWLRNLFVVWFLTGFWHGAAWNFIVWGLFFGVLLALEKLWLLEKLEKTHVLGHVYTLLAVMLSFVLFDAESIGSAGESIRAMFGLAGYPMISAESVYYLRSYAVLLAAGAFGALPFLKNAVTVARSGKTGERIVNAAEPLFLLAVLIAATAFLVDGSFNPFLYFRF